LAKQRRLVEMDPATFGIACLILALPPGVDEACFPPQTFAESTKLIAETIGEGQAFRFFPVGSPEFAKHLDERYHREGRNG
jgi:hypothetical protein